MQTLPARIPVTAMSFANSKRGWPRSGKSAPKLCANIPIGLLRHEELDASCNANSSLKLCRKGRPLRSFSVQNLTVSSP